MMGRKRSREKRLSDVNLIPKKEAIAYLEKNIPRDINEAETTRSLIKLIDLGLVDPGYQNGYVIYQARPVDYTVLVTILSTYSEQQIASALPLFMKMKEDHEKELKTQLKKGMISEPLIETLKKISNFTAREIKSVRAQILEEMYKNKYIDEEMTSKISEYFSILSESETRTSNTKINEILIEINKLVEETERKNLETELFENKAIKLFEKISNQSASEVKRIISEEKKKLEEK